MISKISSLSASWLFSKGIIQDEDIDIYSYGLFMIFSYGLFFLLATCIGMIMHIPIEAIVFYIVLCIVRNYAGGIHAQKELHCLILSVTMIVCSITLIRFLNNISEIFIYIIAGGVSVICCLIGPVASKNKKISKEESRSYRKKLLIIITVLLFCIYVFEQTEVDKISIAITIGIVSATILQIIGKIQIIHKNRI